MAQKAIEWLTQNRVPHVFLNPNDPALEPEKQRGYIVLAMVEADVPEATTQQLIGRCGEILDADISSLDKLSEYNQRLELIKPQKKRKLSELQEKYSSFYPDEPLHLPMRSLPTLLSIENYEWLQSDGSFSEPIPTWRLSVEPSKLETVEDWLKENGIVFERATVAKDLEAEGQLGYALIRLKESSAVQAALTEKFDQPLDATGLKGNYYQRLNEIEKGVSGKAVSMIFPSLQLNPQANQIASSPQPLVPSPSQGQSAKPFREHWEAAMLRAAFSSLETHCSPKDEISTASFANGRYRAIYYPPTDTLYITDERQNRGTLYQAKRGEPATINEFSSLEKQRFLLSEREAIQTNDFQIEAHQKSLELDD